MFKRQYYRVREVADLLAVDVSTVYRWIDRGAIRCSRLGPRSIRIGVDELRRFLESRKERNDN